jgi:peptide/nickel transport system ATP-binding protein
MSDRTALLEVTNLTKYFPVRKGVFRRINGWVKAVDGVDFEIRPGETLGLVGESGCGKSTTGRAILRLVQPDAGSKVLFHNYGRPVDLATVSRPQLKELRKHMQIVFQDPYSSLNPRMSVGEIVGEPLVVHKVAHGKELERRVDELLTLVGLDSTYARRYPHEFSGGQRQRIGIARSIALDPKLLILDEAVSSLDVSVQAQIINLLVELQHRLDLSYLFIAHDLGVVRYISDRVAVMYLGKIVEVGETEEIFTRPKHPYTEALLSSMLNPDPDAQSDRIELQGDVPSPIHTPSGCFFHTRCPYFKREGWEKCRAEMPLLQPIGGGEHKARCHFADDLRLQGVPPRSSSLPPEA